MTRTFLLFDAAASQHAFHLLQFWLDEEIEAEEDTDEEDENAEREDAEHESESSNAAELGNFRKNLHRKSWLWSQQQVLFLVCYFSYIL